MLVNSEIGFKKAGQNAETHLSERPDLQPKTFSAQTPVYSEKYAI